VSERLTPNDDEEFLAAIGPGVEALFPDHPLRAGQQRGVAPEVTRRLNPPPLPPAVFIAVAGVAATAGVASGVFAVLNVLAAQDVAATMESAKTTPYPATELTAKRERTDQLAIATIAGAGVTGVLAAVAVVVFLFTDWGE
jgi:hypothetical protein